MSENDNGQEHEAGPLKGALNKVADTVGGVVGKASAASAGSHSSQAFVTNACVGDLYEVEAGRLAAERGTSEPVRAFGEMMVEHHTSAMHQMQSALMSGEVRRQFSDIAPTRELDERRGGMLKHLRESPDEAFDKTYLDQQRMAHQESVSLHKGYAENGDNPQLRSVAFSGLPMIERHLARLERMASAA